MKKFNKNIEEKKIDIKQNKNALIKRTSIIFSSLVLVVLITLFTFAKFTSNSNEYTLMHGKILDSSNGDINISYVVDGVPQNIPPEKGTGYRIKNIDCTNADGEWDSNRWALIVEHFSGKAKCNLEFELATSVNVTLYGPPGAIITYTDTTGAHSQTLDSTGKKENVNIGIMDNITFTDTNIAKDPNNLSNNYTKTITISDETTEIYVMPNNAIYWYGYSSSAYQNGSSFYSGYSYGGKFTVNANNMSCSRPCAACAYGTVFSNPINIGSYSYMKGIIDNAYYEVSVSDQSGNLYVAFAKATTSDAQVTFEKVGLLPALDSRLFDGYTKLLKTENYATYTTVVSAIWFE